MFVTNHVLAGASIGLVLRRRPVAAFTAGVASHLAMDAVPHFDCRPATFLTVARRDGVLGLAVIAAVAAASDRPVAPVLAGMAGAALLDLNKPAHHFFGFSPFPKPVDRFHAAIQQGKTSPERLRQELTSGVVLATVAAVLISRSRRRRRHAAQDADESVPVSPSPNSASGE